MANSSKYINIASYQSPILKIPPSRFHPKGPRDRSQLLKLKEIVEEDHVSESEAEVDVPLPAKCRGRPRCAPLATVNDEGSNGDNERPAKPSPKPRSGEASKLHCLGFPLVLLENRAKVRSQRIQSPLKEWQKAKEKNNWRTRTLVIMSSMNQMRQGSIQQSLLILLPLLLRQPPPKRTARFPHTKAKGILNSLVLRCLMLTPS
ncbi:hypothetical protein NHQ30_005315 [Ciborinia camelliae]|nr:hypothetical protein NHQ30_005315 [Ciborinia camelliae]